MGRPLNSPAKVGGGEPHRTGQTGQKQHHAFYEIKEVDGLWHWCLWSANGRALATCVTPYSRQKDAIQAISVIAENAAKAKLVLKSHGQEG